MAIGRAVSTPRRRSSLPPRKDKPDIVKIHRQLARQGGGEGLDAAGGHLTARLWSSASAFCRGTVPLGETTTGHSITRLGSPSPEAGMSRANHQLQGFKEQQFVMQPAHQLRVGHTSNADVDLPDFKPASSMVLFIVATCSVISFAACETGRSPSAGSPARRWAARRYARCRYSGPLCGSAPPAELRASSTLTACVRNCSPTGLAAPQTTRSNSRVPVSCSSSLRFRECWLAQI